MTDGNEATETNETTQDRDQALLQEHDKSVPKTTAWMRYDDEQLFYAKLVSENNVEPIALADAANALTWLHYRVHPITGQDDMVTLVRRLMRTARDEARRNRAEGAVVQPDGSTDSTDSTDSAQSLREQLQMKEEALRQAQLRIDWLSEKVQAKDAQYASVDRAKLALQRRLELLEQAWRIGQESADDEATPVIVQRAEYDELQEAQGKLSDLRDELSSWRDSYNDELSSLQRAVENLPEFDVDLDE